jgi:hypothetical protein
MRKSEEITREESQDTEIQLGDLVSFLGELTMHLGSISRFFQSKTGDQEPPVMSLRSKAIQDEIEKSFLAIGREVYTNSNANPKPGNVSPKIGSLFSRVEILQEIMDEINGKTPVDKSVTAAREEIAASPAEEKPEKPEEKPAVKAEEKPPVEAEEKPPVEAGEKTPDEAGDQLPVKTEEAGPGKVEEDAAAADTEKEVAPESSS